MDAFSSQHRSTQSQHRSIDISTAKSTQDYYIESSFVANSISRPLLTIAVTAAFISKKRKTLWDITRILCTVPDNV